MNKTQPFPLLIIIMVTSTLIVTAVSISYLTFDILQRLETGMLETIDQHEIRASLIRTGGFVVITTLLVTIIACGLFFRIIRPFTQKIEQQAETFHTLANTAHEAILLIDIHGIIQFINPAAENMFGYTAEELLGENIKQLMPAPHRNKHDGYLNDYLQSGIKKIIGSGRQLIGQRKDASQFPMYLSVGEIQLKHNHLFAGLIMDLSTQQKLQGEILAIPAREQQRIGEELHDGLGQQLTGLSMLAESLLNKASKPEYELADQLARGLHEALTQVRALSRGLMPVQIYADGFIISLQEITESIEQQSQIPIKLQIDAFVLLFDDVTATHLYRIVQESLNNAVKHAEASQIRVSLKIEQDHGLLEIIDNGIGIPPNLEKSSGLGLSIMKHRCALFDGEISIKPAGECGTQVRCRFPINQLKDTN